MRQALAVAYYDAIARYLARRGSHVGYQLRSGPDRATAGERVLFVVDVRNQGTEPMKGWDLVVGAVPAERPYVGRPRSPEAVGERRIPRLEPGETATLTIEVTAPAPGPAWVLLFDARDGDGRRASRSGSPVLQVPLTTHRILDQGCSPRHGAGWGAAAAIAGPMRVTPGCDVSRLPEAHAPGFVAAAME